MLSPSWKENKLYSEDECDFNIVDDWHMRDKINAQWLKHPSKGKRVKSIGEMTVFVGMPVISHKQLKKAKIENSIRFHIRQVLDDTIVVENDIDMSSIEVSSRDFSTAFRHCWAETVT